MSTRAPTMLTSAVLAHPQLELIAAHSVNHQATASSSTRTTISPMSLRTVRLRVAGVSLVLYQTLSTSGPSASRRSRSSWVSGFCACRQPRQLVLKRPHCEQARVTALLQFGRDQTGPCSRPSSHLPYFFVYF
jgi:hypothetical protein